MIARAKRRLAGKRRLTRGASIIFRHLATTQLDLPRRAWASSTRLSHRTIDIVPLGSRPRRVRGAGLVDPVSAEFECDALAVGIAQRVRDRHAALAAGVETLIDAITRRRRYEECSRFLRVTFAHAKRRRALSRRPQTAKFAEGRNKTYRSSQVGDRMLRSRIQPDSSQLGFSRKERRNGRAASRLSRAAARVSVSCCCARRSSACRARRRRRNSPASGAAGSP